MSELVGRLWQAGILSSVEDTGNTLSKHRTYGTHRVSLFVSESDYPAALKLAQEWSVSNVGRVQSLSKRLARQLFLSVVVNSVAGFLLWFFMGKKVEESMFFLLFPGVMVTWALISHLEERRYKAKSEL